MPKTSFDWRYRFVPSIFAAFIFGVIALFWQFDRAAYLMMMGAYIWTTPGNVPFGDLHAVLMAGACWAKGVYVYVPNPCMYGGSFNYSPVLLRIALLGMGQGLLLPAGTLLSLVFIASCAFLPVLLTRAEVVLRCAIICSPAAAHGMEAWNIDLAMFVFIVAGVALLLAGFAARLAGYALFLAGGVLKFYPALLMLLALRESRRRLVCIGGALVCGGAYVLWHMRVILGTVLAALPLGLPFRGYFGAINLPFGVSLLAFMPRPSVAPDGVAFHTALHQPHLAEMVMLSSKCITLAGVLAGWRLAAGYTQGMAALDEGRRVYLVAGALLVAFCFFVAPNYEYRGIFLLCVVPGLSAMALSPARRPAIWPMLMLVLMALLLWEKTLWEMFSWIGNGIPSPVVRDGLGIVLWGLREVFWWLIAINLAAIGFAYLRMAVEAIIDRKDEMPRDEYA